MNLTRRNAVLGGSATALLAARAKAATQQSYYFLVFNNPVPGKEKEYLAWYDQRHIFDVTAIPGFVSGQRFIRNDIQMYPGIEPKLPTYLTLYEVKTDDLEAVAADILKRIQTGVTKFEQPSVIEGGTGVSYWYRFNTPEIKRSTAWPAEFRGKKMANFRHVVFMNAMSGKQAEWEAWYDATHSPEMLALHGFMTSQRTTLARPAPNMPVPPTKEMVMFSVALPEGYPADSVPPKTRSAAAGLQDPTSTRGYTYRQIGPLVTHKEAVAKKAKFKT